jgi:hypothetical protein
MFNLLRAICSSLILALLLPGCAEFRNRGGTTDWVEDYFFKADTKSLRLIRSYTLLAGLARISGKSPFSLEERKEVAQKIETAVGLSRDAFDCVYDRRNGLHGCVFFDDIMAQLDLSLLRLARITFLPEENKDLLAVLQKELFGGDLPKNLFGAAGKIAEAAGEVGLVGGQAANVVGALLQLGQNALRTGGRLGPIYRDSVELRMLIVLDGLNTIAKNIRGNVCMEFREPVSTRTNESSPRLAAEKADDAKACLDFHESYQLYNDPSVSLSLWSAHAAGRFAQYGNAIRPGRYHFTQVSSLVLRACAGLMGGATAEADKCARLVTNDSDAGPPRSLIFGKDAKDFAWGKKGENAVYRID